MVISARLFPGQTHESAARFAPFLQQKSRSSARSLARRPTQELRRGNTLFHLRLGPDGQEQERPKSKQTAAKFMARLSHLLSSFSLSLSLARPLVARSYQNKRRPTLERPARFAQFSNFAHLICARSGASWTQGKFDERVDVIIRPADTCERAAGDGRPAPSACQLQTRRKKEGFEEEKKCRSKGGSLFCARLSFGPQFA